MSLILRFACGGILFLMLMAVPGRANAFDHVAMSVIGMAMGLTIGAAEAAEPETPAELAAPLDQPEPPMPLVSAPPGGGSILAAVQVVR